MFLHYLSEYQALGYLIIFLGMMIEGDVLLFTVGFLVYRNYFNIDIAFLMIFFGVVIGDNIWYVIGELLCKKDHFLIRFMRRLAEPFDNHLKKNIFRTIFISKFAYGLHRSILLRIGMLKLPFKEFIRSDVIASIIWILIVGGLGYLSSASFLLIRRYLRYTELTLLLGIAVFILISHIITAISKKEL